MWEIALPTPLRIDAPALIFIRFKYHYIPINERIDTDPTNRSMCYF